MIYVQGKCHIPCRHCGKEHVVCSFFLNDIGAAAGEKADAAERRAFEAEAEKHVVFANAGSILGELRALRKLEEAIRETVPGRVEQELKAVDDARRSQEAQR